MKTIIHKDSAVAGCHGYYWSVPFRKCVQIENNAERWDAPTTGGRREYQKHTYTLRIWEGKSPVPVEQTSNLHPELTNVGRFYF